MSFFRRVGPEAPGAFEGESMRTVYQEIDRVINHIREFNKSDRIVDTPNPHPLDPGITEVNSQILITLENKLTKWSETNYQNPSGETLAVTKKLKQIVSNLEAIIENPGTTREEIIRNLESLKNI